MSTLRDIVFQLVSLKKEGDFWDFKLKHHENTVDLVKDITCLANTTRHKGKRYLIFGVCPNTYELKGVNQSELRRTQADIIDALRNANFSTNNFPDITLETIEFENRKIDIIIISDSPNKPYYLEKEYQFRGKRMRAGAIYSRTQDTNTPYEGTAAVADTEQMWRERFGLTEPPLERLRNYLADFKGWDQVFENKWHYKQFPEFTMCPTEEDTRAVEAGESWVRACTNPNAFVRPMIAKFHQTIMAKTDCIYFDEMRGLIPAPSLTMVRDTDEKWFYSFCAGENLDYAFLQFFTRKNKHELPENILTDGRYRMLPVIVFSSSQEKEKFLASLKDKVVQILDRHVFRASGVSEHDCNIISYSRAVIERFKEWKSR